MARAPLGLRARCPRRPPPRLARGRVPARRRAPHRDGRGPPARGLSDLDDGDRGPRDAGRAPDPGSLAGLRDAALRGADLAARPRRTTGRPADLARAAPARAVGERPRQRAARQRARAAPLRDRHRHRRPHARPARDPAPARARPRRAARAVRIALRPLALPVLPRDRDERRVPRPDRRVDGHDVPRVAGVLRRRRRRDRLRRAPRGEARALRHARPGRARAGGARHGPQRRVAPDRRRRAAAPCARALVSRAGLALTPAPRPRRARARRSARRRRTRGGPHVRIARVGLARDRGQRDRRRRRSRPGAEGRERRGLRGLAPVAAPRAARTHRLRRPLRAARRPRPQGHGAPPAGGRSRAGTAPSRATGWRSGSGPRTPSSSRRCSREPAPACSRTRTACTPSRAEPDERYRSRCQYSDTSSGPKSWKGSCPTSSKPARR